MITEVTMDMIKKTIPIFGEKVHKGSRGKVLVIGGSKGMLGAAIFAARSAFRNGCGLVHLAIPAKYLSLVNVSNPELITIPTRGSYLNLVRDNNYEAILIGPGLSRNRLRLHNTRQLLLYLSRYRPQQKVLLDADGLLALRGIYRKLDLDLVITPHMKEMEKLTWRPLVIIKKDPYRYSKVVSNKYPCTVVLKDYNTYITQGERKFLNKAGTQALAKGGSGDVLSGVIASFMAQGSTGLEGAIIGSFVHALCGRVAAKQKALDCLTPQDLIAAIPQVHRLLKGN